MQKSNKKNQGKHEWLRPFYLPAHGTSMFFLLHPTTNTVFTSNMVGLIVSILKCGS